MRCKYPQLKHRLTTGDLSDHTKLPSETLSFNPMKVGSFTWPAKKRRYKA